MTTVKYDVVARTTNGLTENGVQADNSGQQLNLILREETAK